MKLETVNEPCVVTKQELMKLETVNELCVVVKQELSEGVSRFRQLTNSGLR